MSKRILLITNIPAPYMVDLIGYMQKQMCDYEIYVLYTSRNEDNRQWNANIDKIKNSFFASSYIIKLKTRFDFRYVHIPTNIFKHLNKLNPDIVIAWEYNLAAIQSLLWCKFRGRKYLSLTEGTLLSESSLNIIQKITRYIIKNKADAFLVSGIKAREKLLSWGVDNNKIFTELLTVDISKIRNCKRLPNPATILYVGSMAERKGLDLLLYALARIELDYEFRIVGNGNQDDINKLKNIISELKLEEKVKWVGFKEGQKLVEEYSKATVFVLPTREDCFGLVLLEALAAGVPIVASKFADGAYDVIDEGKTGYIIDPYNEKELADAIQYVIQNPEIQKSCYEFSRESINKFEFSEVIKGFEKAIDYVKDN